MNKKDKVSFTKIWVERLLWFGCIWMTCSYILAFLGRDNIAETLSVTVAAEIIGVFITYSAKSFFENNSKANLQYKRERDLYESCEEGE